MAGEGEVRLLLVIVLTSGVLSAFMNNVGVAALLLPVVMDIARQTRRAPSKLLMPLAFGSLLGLLLLTTAPRFSFGRCCDALLLRHGGKALDLRHVETEALGHALAVVLACLIE